MPGCTEISPLPTAAPSLSFSTKWEEKATEFCKNTLLGWGEGNEDQQEEGKRPFKKSLKLALQSFFLELDNCISVSA